MRRLTLFATLIRPCNALDMDTSATQVLDYVMGLIVMATTFALCYIFYPAYVASGRGIGSNDVTLSGKKSDGEAPILSLVIPAYNEEKRLPIMLNDTFKYLNKNRGNLTDLFYEAVGVHPNRKHSKIQYEFIIVDDGSADDTAGVAKKYGESVKSGDIFKIISMNRNCGKGGAVRTGMLKSTGQLCLMIDSDGATDISDGLIKLLKEMKVLTNETRHNQENASMVGGGTSLPRCAVFGSRSHLEKESCASRSQIRTFLMHSFHFFVKTLCSHQIKDTQCGFKLFTRSAVVLLFTNLHLRRWAFDTELVVIAEKLNILLSEVGVIWHEVDGSKLDVNKFALALVSLGMLRDMVCVRACYSLGIWKLNR